MSRRKDDDSGLLIAGLILTFSGALANMNAALSRTTADFFLRVRGKDGTVRYRRYIETDLLLARSYYVSDTPKRTDKPQENLLNQLQTQFKELYSNDDRLTTKNITMAGKFDRAYQLDMSKGNKEVILSWYILKQKAHVKGLTLLEEERYNVYKLYRINNNI
jgi:hypothetical protein